MKGRGGREYERRQRKSMNERENVKQLCHEEKLPTTKPEIVYARSRLFSCFYLKKENNLFPKQETNVSATNANANLPHIPFLIM